MATPSSALAISLQLASSSPAEAQALFVNLDQATQAAVLALLSSSSVYTALLVVQNVIATQGLAVAQSIYGSYNLNVASGASSVARLPSSPTIPPQNANQAPVFSVSSNLLAAGTTQQTATQLQSGFNQVVGGSGGVVIQSQPGTEQVVANYSGAFVYVYPPSGLPSLNWNQLTGQQWCQWNLPYGVSGQASINNLPAGTGYPVGNNSTQVFYSFTATQIYTQSVAATIASVTPDSCYLQGNTYVVILGSGLSTVSSITFGGVNSQYIFVKSDNEIHCSPFPVEAAGVVDLVVTIASRILTTTFTFNAATIAGTLTYITEAGVYGLSDICNGNDGNLWAATYYGTLWVFSTSGAIIGSQVLTSNSKIQRVIAGSGGKIWTIDLAGNLWRVFTDLSNVANVALPDGSIDSQLIDVCAGPDGAFYVAGNGDGNPAFNCFWKVNDALQIIFSKPYAYGSGNAYGLDGICSSPDGTLLALAYGPTTINILVQFNTSGVALNTWALPTVPGSSFTIFGDQLQIGPDGNVWTSYNATVSGVIYQGLAIINRSNPGATPTFIPLLNCNSGTPVIILGNYRPGPDGNYYALGAIYSGSGGGQTTQGKTAVVSYIFKVTPQGVVTEYQTNLAASLGDPVIELYGVCAGSNGAVYATQVTPLGTNGTLVKLT